MPSKAKLKRRKRLDVSTPEERRLLDRMVELRRECMESFDRWLGVFERYQGGGFSIINDFGVYPEIYTLGWVRKEIRRLQARLRREESQEARRMVGAFI